MIRKTHLIAFTIERLAKQVVRGMIEKALRKYGSLEAVATAAGWQISVIHSYWTLVPVPAMDGEVVCNPDLSEIHGRTPAAFEREIRFTLARATHPLLSPVLSARELESFTGYAARNFGRRFKG